MQYIFLDVFPNQETVTEFSKVNQNSHLVVEVNRGGNSFSHHVDSVLQSLSVSLNEEIMVNQSEHQ